MFDVLNSVQYTLAHGQLNEVKDFVSAPQFTGKTLVTKSGHFSATS
jgi:hypothetical protein